MIGVVLATSPSALLRGNAKVSWLSSRRRAALTRLFDEFLLFLDRRLQRVNLLLLRGQLRLQRGDIVVCLFAKQPARPAPDTCPNNDVPNRIAEHRVTLPSVLAFIISIPDWVFQDFLFQSEAVKFVDRLTEDSPGALAKNDGWVNIALQRIVTRLEVRW